LTCAEAEAATIAKARELARVQGALAESQAVLSGETERVAILEAGKQKLMQVRLEAIFVLRIYEKHRPSVISGTSLMFRLDAHKAAQAYPSLDHESIMARLVMQKFPRPRLSQEIERLSRDKVDEVMSGSSSEVAHLKATIKSLQDQLIETQSVR